MDHVLARRLAVIHADTGLGKSTLLHSWTAGINAVTYQATGDDTDVALFARRLADTLGGAVPGLSADLVPGTTADNVTAGGTTSQPDALAELIGESLTSRLKRDAVLVVDDVHAIGDGAASRFLAGLIRHAPPLLHLVLAGRTLPPVPTERLRTNGELVELYGADLAFTVEEVARLLEITLGADATSLAPAIHRTTAGWPAAVRLSAGALTEISPPDRPTYVTSVAKRGGIAGLARVIINGEPVEIRQLLATVAVFDEVCSDLLDAVGVRDRALLATLARRGLFLVPGASGDGWYRVHPLVRDAVQNEGRVTESDAARLRSTSAGWLLAADRPHDAVNVLMAAADHPQLVATLRQVGQQLISDGQAATVNRAVTSLPDRHRTATMERLAGDAYQWRGQWTDALACYERARPPCGTLDAGLAWRMGLIHYFRGDAASAMSIYQRAESTTEPTRDRALLLAWTAAAHWGGGDVDTCGRVAAEALRVAADVDDAQAQAAAHTVLSMLAVVEGDPRASDAHYEAALEQAKRAGDVLQLARIRSNRGSHLVAEGAYAEALDELDQAISMADLAGFSAFAALALNNRGEARLRLGRLEEAHSDLRTAAAAFEELGSGWIAFPLPALGAIAALRGDVTTAQQRYERALALAEEAGDVQAQVPVLSGLARLIADEDPERATTLAARAVARGTDHGAVTATLAAGWVALARGDLGDARAYADQSRRAAEARRDRPGAADAVTLQAAATGDPDLAGESIKAWEKIGDPIGWARAIISCARVLDDSTARTELRNVHSRMREIGCRQLETAATSALAGLRPEPASRIRVETLGRVRVVRDGQVVDVSTWKSRKARDLLKVLISRRGRPLTRDHAIEILWPGQTPAEVGNRLNVILSTIRSQLDPRRTAGPEGVVPSDGDAFRLDCEHVEIDVEQFLADAANGLRLVREDRETDATPYLRRAEACYTGDFLEECRYDEWAAPLREEARATYREVATRLAGQSRRAGDADAAIRYLLRALECDPYDERSHLDLVTVLAASGRPGDARRHYRTYCSRMDELEVDAAPFPVASHSR
jgi:ATP/maltotriose-dependent transcriptional regulator MalT/DNA-binding SARP family transcriptional activator